MTEETSNAWKTKIVHAVSRNILQMLAIQRRDSNEWAIPGGMIDPGEIVTNTLKREFIEEALNSQKGVEYISIHPEPTSYHSEYLILFIISLVNAH